MSLNKQLVHLNMRGGIDNKDDERLVIPSKLVDLQNAVFDDASTIIRRGGTSSHALTAMVSGGATVSTIRRLFTNQGNLILEADSGVHRLVKDAGQSLATSPDLSAPADRYPHYLFKRAGATTRPVSGNVEQWPTSRTPSHAGQMDCATSGTRSVWAWEERDTAGTGRLAVRVAVVDEATKAVIYTHFLNDTGAAGYVYCSPRVIYSPGWDAFFVYYGRFTSGGVSFLLRRIRISGAGALDSITEQTVFTSAALGGTVGSAGYELLFDAVMDTAGFQVLLFVRDSAAAMTTIAAYTLDDNDGYTVVNSGTTTASGTFSALTALITTDATYPFVAVYAVGGKLSARRWTGAAFAAETTLVSHAKNIGRITCVQNGDTVYYAYDLFTGTGATYAAEPTGETRLRVATSTAALGSVSNGQGVLGWLLHGRLQVARSRLWLPMFNPSNTQPTVYVIDASGYYDNLSATATQQPVVLARIDYSECGYIRQQWVGAARVPSTMLPSTDVLTVPYQKWVPDAQLVSGQYVQPYQIHRADIDFADQLGHAEVNGLTYLAGACPHIFDGKSVVEEGFHHAPEIYSLTAVATGTGDLFAGLAAATYYACCTVAWQDGRGNWHESAPSNVVSFTTSAGNLDVDAIYSVPPSQKDGYVVLWYRTIAAAATGPFYRAFDQTGTTITSDATLAACEQLYTTPGVGGQPLPHDPAPACRHIENHQDRLFLSGCGDGYEVAYSNQSAEGRGLEFSVLLYKRTDYEFGRIVNSQSQDGKLFVLGERKVGVLLGQGPTDTGGQDGYSDIEVILHDIGAKWAAPKGIATTNEGVWFQSSTGGIRLLGRNGSLVRDQSGKYKGSEVDSRLGTTYTCNAVVGAPKSQIRFYHSGGEVLVYDTTWDQWSYFSGHTHVDAAYAEGRFYHATSSALNYYDEAAQTDVGGGSISMTGETAWLQFAGIQSFQRVYRLMFVGETVDNVTETQRFSLAAYYNYLPAGTALLAEQDVATTDGIIQIEHHLATQKCEALKLVFQFKSKTGVSRFRLTDITLQVGVKQGRFKTPASRRL